jgi:hypothetical protein
VELIHRVRLVGTLAVALYLLAVVLEVARGFAIDRGGWGDDDRG